jgi:hypothetical protein
VVAAALGAHFVDRVLVVSPAGRSLVGRFGTRRAASYRRSRSVSAQTRWLRATLSFEFRFGVNSARLHRREAEFHALTVASLSVWSLDFDVDTPNDLHDLTSTTLFTNNALNALLQGERE